MESKVNFTVVGFFVVALLIGLFFVFFWLSGFRQHKIYDTYIIYMQEDVNGLTVQSSVRFNGVRVGYVDSISLDIKNPQFVIVKIKVMEGTPITTSTVATLMSQGITGVVFIGLKAETTDAPLLKAQKGEKYLVIPAKPSILMQLGEVLPRVAKNVDDISKSIVEVLNKKNRKSISDTLHNLDVFTHTLQENSANLDGAMKDLRTTMDNVNKASESLTPAMQQLRRTLNRIDNASVNVSQTSQSLKYTMRDARTAINNISSQVIPEMQQAFSNLAITMNNFKDFSKELNHNPSIMVRGKQPAAPGPGEK